MTSNNGADRDVDHFMRALSENTPYDRARMPSSRVMWLRAQWADRHRKQDKIARIRLLVEGAAQMVIGIVALLTGFYFWPRIPSNVAALFETILSPSSAYLPLLVVTAALTLFISILGTRMMLRE